MTGRGPRGRARSRPAEQASEPSEPPIVPPSEGGRGRGLAGRAEPSESTTSTSSHSPPGSSNDDKKSDSPPQAAASIGRAALRGKTTSAANVEANLVEPLTRMHLQGGEMRESERQRTFFESVPITRPSTCDSKIGLNNLFI
jgi:hypothetical protein